MGCLVVMLLLMSSTTGLADKAKDREECTNQLVGISTCLPYVGGNAKSPTPDCCTGLKQVLIDDKKCLCVIIRDRNDPELGLNFNVTLALGLPSVCHAPANVSQCPALLHLNPTSPEAQVFYHFGSRSNSTGATNLVPSPSPTATTPVAEGEGRGIPITISATSSSNRRAIFGCLTEKRLPTLMEIVPGEVLLLFYFIINFHILQ